MLLFLLLTVTLANVDAQGRSCKTVKNAYGRCMPERRCNLADHSPSDSCRSNQVCCPNRVVSFRSSVCTAADGTPGTCIKRADCLQQAASKECTKRREVCCANTGPRKEPCTAIDGMEGSCLRRNLCELPKDTVSPDCKKNKVCCPDSALVSKIVWCTKVDGSSGTCARSTECKDVQFKSQLLTCGGRRSFVCCPDKTTSAPPEIVEVDASSPTS